MPLAAEMPAPVRAVMRVFLPMPARMPASREPIGSGSSMAAPGPGAQVFRAAGRLGDIFGEYSRRPAGSTVEFRRRFVKTGLARIALWSCLALTVCVQGQGRAAVAPPVRFVVQDERAAAVARLCHEAWLREGPGLAAALLPADVAVDTVTCLLLDSSSFQERFGQSIPDWGVGLAFPDGRHVAVDHDGLPAVGRGVTEVFLHEMVHALLFQGAGDTWLPTWFHEGCAMRYSGEWRFSDTVSLLLDGHVPNLDRLQGRFPAQAQNADRAYRTSLLAVTRLQNRFGDDAPGRLVAAARATGSFEAAFPRATGTTLTDFTADFAGAMRLRLGWLVMLTRWPTLFVVASLIFILGAARKFVRSRRRLAEMEAEESS